MFNSLSGRFLLLTIIFVMIAEVLIFVPSVARFREDYLLQRLENVHREFGRPLWITEFAVGDWEAKSVAENRHSPKAVARFMQEALPALEAASFVDRYAWFSAGQQSRALGTSALFDKQGNLTPLGEVYRGV